MKFVNCVTYKLDSYLSTLKTDKDTRPVFLCVYYILDNKFIFALATKICFQYAVM